MQYSGSATTSSTPIISGPIAGHAPILAKSSAQVHDCIVIGAGQAGLAAAWQLSRAGLDFRILEAGPSPVGSWPAYYDSLTLFSPVKYSSLPGLAMPGAPDRYPSRDEVVSYLQAYAQHFDFPVETKQHVTQVDRQEGHFVVSTAGGSEWRARTVIVASGGFSQPHIPALPGLSAFGGRVLHSRDYRSPQGLKGQRIVVVGGANSGVQIAVELAQVARVSLATLRPIRFVPQRLLGKDFHFWLSVTGLEQSRWLSDQSTPVLDDGRYRRAIRAGKPERRAMFQQLTDKGVVWDCGTEEPVDTLLFATGFRPNVDFLSGFKPLDDRGQLRQHKGVSTIPGLYYVGFPRQRSFASATLRGVGPDAALVVERLRSYLLNHQVVAGLTARSERADRGSA